MLVIWPDQRADQIRDLGLGDGILLAKLAEVMTKPLGDSGIVYEGLSEEQARGLGVDR